MKQEKYEPSILSIVTARKFSCFENSDENNEENLMSDIINIPEINRDYDIGERLGEGGYGVVLKAYHRRLRKNVVIKESKLVVSEEKARAEVDILKNLHHPNLPQVFDFFIDNGRAYTVMDFIEGESVGSMLKRNYKFSRKEVYKYAKQLLTAIDHLHSRTTPIIHGDIKPDNIMITPEGNLCLIDFNISGISDGATAYTNGYTPGYGAPEQEKAFKQIKQMLRENQNKGNYAQSDNAAANRDIDGQTDDMISHWNTVHNITEVSEQLVDTEDVTEVLRCTTEETELLHRDPIHADDPGATEIDYTIGNTGYRNIVSSNNKSSQPEGDSQPAKRPFKSSIGDGVPIDMRSDIYSAGASIYHMYTGKIYDPKEKSIVLKGNVSEAFIYVLNKALQRDPDKRFQSGGEMLEALNQIYKKDRDYRRLQVRTAVLRVLMVAMLVGGIVCIREGRKLSETEKEDRYDANIEKMAYERELINSTDFPETTVAYVTGSNPVIDASASRIEKLYSDAVSLFSERPEAYYQRALYLYYLHQYESAEQFIYSSLQNSNIAFTSSDREKMYYILGNCFYEEGYFEDAADAFEKSILNGTTNPAVYSDYAIVLTELGRIAEGERILNEAIKLGLGDDILLLTQGEIALMQVKAEGGKDVSKIREIIKDFDDCLKTSGDEYTKYHAYIDIGQAYDVWVTAVRSGQASEDEKSERDIIDIKLGYYEKGIEKLSQKYRIQLYEYIVQSCDQAYLLTNDPNYDLKALNALEKLRETGYATRSTYESMCNLYRRQGLFDDALRVLGAMETKYSENYRTYMLLAFTYAQIEAENNADDRNYEAFFRNCDKAEKLYEKVNTQDIEMLSLREIYNEIVEAGWK